jgi:hypothetical protein
MSVVASRMRTTTSRKQAPARLERGLVAPGSDNLLRLSERDGERR